MDPEEHPALHPRDNAFERQQDRRGHQQNHQGQDHEIDRPRAVSNEEADRHVPQQRLRERKSRQARQHQRPVRESQRPVERVRRPLTGIHTPTLPAVMEGVKTV